MMGTGVFAGLIGSLFSLLQFIASPVIGAASDVYGRKPLLLLSMVTDLEFMVFQRGQKFGYFCSSKEKFILKHKTLCPCSKFLCLRKNFVLHSRTIYFLLGHIFTRMTVFMLEHKISCPSTTRLCCSTKFMLGHTTFLCSSRKTTFDLFGTPKTQYCT